MIHQHEKFLHSKAIDFSESPDDHFVNVHIYGRSKLGEDFLITLVVVRGERLNLSYSIKAKEKEMAEMIAAAPGAGAWWNGSRCAVSTVGTLSQATVLTTDERFRERPERRAGWDRVSSNAAVSRSWGDCFGYLLVATGRAEAMLDPVLSPWDAAALQPIVVEAGGVFTDWTGVATAFGGSAVATNFALATDVRRLLDDSHAR